MKQTKRLIAVIQIAFSLSGLSAEMDAETQQKLEAIKNDVAAARKQGLETLSQGKKFHFEQFNYYAHFKNLPASFWQSKEADQMAKNLATWQEKGGGWNPGNMHDAFNSRPSESEMPKELQNLPYFMSTDNGQGTGHLEFMGRVATAQKNQGAEVSPLLQASFEKGFDFISSLQGELGGFKQGIGDVKEDHFLHHVQFNDGTVANVLDLLKAISLGKYDAAINPARLSEIKLKAEEQFQKGIKFILNAQQQANKTKNIWGQQVSGRKEGFADPYAPVRGRDFELPALSTMESANILDLLSENLKHPNLPAELKIEMLESIKAGSAFLNSNTFLVHLNSEGVPECPPHEGQKPENATKVWSRFIDPENLEPFISDRPLKVKENKKTIKVDRKYFLGKPPTQAGICSAFNKLKEVNSDRYRGYLWLVPAYQLALPENTDFSKPAAH